MSGPSRPAAALVAEYLTALELAGASRPLRRQRGWALREAVLFAAAGRVRDLSTGGALTDGERAAAELEVGRVTADELFEGAFVDLWLARADPVLRDTHDTRAPTQRARITSLRALADHARRDRPGHRDGRPVLRPTLSGPELDAAMAALTTRLPGRGSDDHVRLGAVLAVMSVWPARSAELAELRTAQVVVRSGGVRLELPDRVGAPGSGGPVELTGVAADRVRDWLDVREGYAAGLEGGRVHHLWTSIRSNSRPGPRGSLPLPPGMPLRPRGLQRAYARAVESANLAYAEQAGFPLPRSLDLLRRSLVDVAP